LSRYCRLTSMPSPHQLKSHPIYFVQKSSDQMYAHPSQESCSRLQLSRLYIVLSGVTVSCWSISFQFFILSLEVRPKWLQARSAIGVCSMYICVKSFHKFALETAGALVATVPTSFRSLNKLSAADVSLYYNSLQHFCNLLPVNVNRLWCMDKRLVVWHSLVLRSLYFAVNSVLIKLFKTANVNVS
jgi:hypothetical protein